VTSVQKCTYDVRHEEEHDGILSILYYYCWFISFQNGVWLRKIMQRLSMEGCTYLVGPGVDPGFVEHEADTISVALFKQKEY
jgi:hypothetical protein